MRPRSLTVAAFGPFPNQEHVDFTHLDAHGLYLIGGPTGSGKTSLLDAICFALYGRVPGARGELTNDHLRSDHAPASVATRVVFEFDAGGSRWRVARSPEQDRPKQRGTGTTRRPATAELERWENGGWEPVLAKPGAVTERITRLVGLTAEQFRTVVLLPQGRFQEALHASTADRQDLLRTLFGTELYRRVTEVLWRRAKDAHGAVAAGRDELSRHRDTAERHLDDLRRLAAAASPSEPDPTLDPVGADAALDAVAVAAAQGRHGADAAQQELATLRAAAARFDEHAELVARQARLDADEAPAAARHERLVAAERAAMVAEVVDASIQADRTATTAKATLAAASERWTAAAGGARAHDAPALSALCSDEWSATTVEALVGAALTAERAAGLVEPLAVAHRDLALAEASLADADARAATAAARVVKLQDRLGALDQELVAARQAAAPHAELAGRLERARVVLDRALEAVELAGQLDAARRAVARTQHTATEAEQSLAVTRRLRDASLAASLATELRAGAECPVCGSVEHPQPARPPHDVPDASELAWLESQAAVAQREHGIAQGEVAALAARAAEHAGAVSVEQARAEVAVLEQSLAVAATAAELVERLVAEQEERRGEVQRCVDDQHAAALERTEWANRAAELRSRATELADAIASVCGSVEPTVVLDITRALRTARATLDEASARCERAAEEARQAHDLEARSLLAVGFGSRDSWAGAHLDPDQVAELAEAVRRRDEECTHLAAGLALLLSGPPLPAERPDVEAAERVAVLAVSRAQELEQHLGDARRLHLLAVEAAGAAERAEHGLEAALAHAATLETVAAACRGANGQPGLETWVLAVVLGEVALAANQWLAQLSDGRYQLQLGSPTSGRGQSGLELAVLDAHSGVVRPVQTLSGGETFQASLALALGLADVVGAHSGGVSLDALFIDEGFGSLDRDALEQAVQQLERLRAGGRLVGVISHVETLGERLPTGIQLQRCGVGSTVVQPLRDEPIALGAGA
jgi:exonuclease SbcC